jgi:hypothetical protein
MLGLDVARDVLAGAAKSPVPPCDDAELLAAAAVLAEAERYLDATVAHLLAEIERRKAVRRVHGLSAATWWARTTGSSVGAARRRVRTALALDESFGHLGDAVVRGELGWDRAEAITGASNPRIASAMASIQPELLDLSDHTTYRRFRTDLADLARRIDADGGYRPDADPDASTAHLDRHGDGSVTLRGTWHGPDATTFAELVDAFTDTEFHRAQRDHDTYPEVGIPTRAVLRARAIAALARRGAATDIAASTPPQVEATLVIRANDPHPATTLDGTTLPDGTTRTLTCNPSVRALVVDQAGEPLHLGRTRRLFTPAQRHAITIRDGGCTFPGCDTPATWTDTHHALRWQHGGPTDTTNATSLCRRHHTLVHHDHWTFLIDHDSPHHLRTWPILQSPTGQRRWTQRHGRTPDAPIPTGGRPMGLPPPHPP